MITKNVTATQNSGFDHPDQTNRTVENHIVLKQSIYLLEHIFNIVYDGSHLHVWFPSKQIHELRKP